MAGRMKIVLTMMPCRRLRFNISDLYPVPRLGIGYLSAYLKAHGYRDVSTPDIIAERWWIPELLREFARTGPPDVLGLSVTAISLREAFELATAVKAVYTQCRIVVGGPGVGFEAEALLRYGSDVDFFVRGEGEEPLLQLVRALETGADLSAVPALIWRKNAKPVENPPGAYRNLDDGIFCDYDAQPMDKYRLHPPMGAYPLATMMETTRGCTFPCEFCCLRAPARYRSVENVVAELKRLQNVYGIREVHFIDPTFSLYRKRTWELVEAVGALGLRWTCKTRVDMLDEELIEHFARNGCYYIAFGVESGDDTILGNIHKATAAETALHTFHTCRKHRIRTAAYMLVGSPGETIGSIRNTMAFVRKLQPDYVLYGIVHPDPANTMSQKALANKAFTKRDLEAYYLSDEPSYFQHTTVGGQTIRTAQRWLNMASWDFYGRPSYIKERVLDVRTTADVTNLFVGGITFVKDFAGVGRLWNMRGRNRSSAS